jgi:glycosyltransferase involved in cell wall biosynthesis
MARPSLALIVITRNNGRTLRRCLESADFVDEKILVDNSSTDDTRDIAEAFGARVVITTDFPGFSAQKQRALDLVKSDWILALDADEWILPPLKSEMLAALDNPGPHAGFDMPRLSSFCGRLLRHGDWARDRVVRLCRRSHASYGGGAVHDRIHVEGSTGRLGAPVMHEAVFDLEHALWRMNLYSTMTARERHLRGQAASLPGAMVHGFWTFFRSYVLRAGFLDGAPGFYQALTAGEGSFYRYAKLLEMNRAAGPPK